MNLLDKAIVDKFNETTEGVHNAFYSSLPGGLWKSVIPNDTPAPCAAFSVSGYLDHTFKEHQTDYSITFYIFDGYDTSDGGIKSPYAINAIADNCRSLFDGCKLSISGYTTTTMYETGQMEEEWLADEQVWRYSITFEFTLFKNR